MGFFDIFKRKSILDNIKREDVVKHICDLEDRANEILADIDARQNEIDRLMAKGKNEKNKSIQMVYAKKIQNLQSDNSRQANRLNVIYAEKENYHQLKTAIDDNSFASVDKKSLMQKLSADPEKLAKQLSKVQQKRMVKEEQIASASEIFKNAEDEYVPNESIQGVNNTVDSILAMFESDDLEIKEEAPEPVRQQSQEIKEEN